MADAEERRKRRQRAALAGLMLFSPWKKLRPHIAMAAHDIEDYFDAVDIAMATRTLSESLRAGTSITPALSRLIRASYVGGFEAGGQIAGITPGRNTLAVAQRLANARAAEAAGGMVATSRKWLKANPDNAFAVSSARAERAAKFEAGRAFYGGLQMVLSGRGMQKSWMTTSDNPCDDCLDNEDQGAIPMEEIFQSGEDAPPMHLHCECVLAVSQ